MIEPLIKEDAPLELTTKLSALLHKHELIDKSKTYEDFYKNEDFIVRDYIIYNSYRITQELKIKAIVCYTENGYTTARLASLNPKVPIIAFSKLDTTYRYLNSIRGIK